MGKEENDLGWAMALQRWLPAGAPGGPVHVDCWAPPWGLWWSWGICIFGGAGVENFYCSSSSLGGGLVGEGNALC